MPHSCRKLSHFFIMIIVLLKNIHCFASAAQEKLPVTVRLVSSTTALGKQDTVLIGAEFMIEKGWKIYAPFFGKAATSLRHPQFQWQPNSHIKQISIVWPTPAQMVENGLEIPVYKGRVILPLAVDMLESDHPLHLEGIVNLIACSTICVPIDQKLVLDIPKGNPQNTVYADEIIAFQTGNHVPTEIPSWWVMSFIALLGGFVLNFMPCVLPVLSLKLKALVRRPANQTYRWNFAATFLGIMISFWGFAALAIALQAGGKSFGWGMHFQEPLFIAFMALLMVLFAANLWGLFEIQLPYSISRFLQSQGRTGQGHIQESIEGFFSGVFATLLATPCTAPFLGTALGYALSQGPQQIILLFTLLGIGFGLPYLVLLVLPPRFIPVPKPGRWMTILSKVLSLGLMLTALWLLWILMQSKGVSIALSVSALLALMVILLARSLAKGWMKGGAALCMVGVLTVTYCTKESPNHFYKETSASYWQPFSQVAIQEALKKEKIVFVDVTASWCTTCQLNKAMVTNRAPIQHILQSSQVVALKADWTTHDETIGRYLAEYGRFGIPFNIVYGPKAPQGILLPELLSERAVIEAFERAGYQER